MSQETDKTIHERAVARKQNTFTLVEQDKTTPQTICFWILMNILTAPPEKLHDALDDAIIMRDHPHVDKQKWAD